MSYESPENIETVHRFLRRRNRCVDTHLALSADEIVEKLRGDLTKEQVLDCLLDLTPDKIASVDNKPNQGYLSLDLDPVSDSELWWWIYDHQTDPLPAIGLLRRMDQYRNPFHDRWVFDLHQYLITKCGWPDKSQEYQSQIHIPRLQPAFIEARSAAIYVHDRGVDKLIQDCRVWQTLVLLDVTAHEACLPSFQVIGPDEVTRLYWARMDIDGSLELDE